MLELPWSLEVFSIASIMLIVKTYIDFLVPIKLPAEGPIAYKMDNPTASGSATGGEGSSNSVSASHPADRSSMEPLTDANKIRLKNEWNAHILNLKANREGLKRNIPTLIRVHEDENSDTTTRTQAYWRVLNQSKGPKGLGFDIQIHEEKHEYAKYITKGDFSIIWRRARGRPIPLQDSDQDLYDRSLDVLEQYKDA